MPGSSKIRMEKTDVRIESCPRRVSGMPYIEISRGQLSVFVVFFEMFAERQSVVSIRRSLSTEDLTFYNSMKTVIASLMLIILDCASARS